MLKAPRDRHDIHYGLPIRERIHLNGAIRNSAVTHFFQDGADMTSRSHQDGDARRSIAGCRLISDPLNHVANLSRFCRAGIASNRLPILAGERLRWPYMRMPEQALG